MPESRDRLERAVDLAALYANRGANPMALERALAGSVVAHPPTHTQTALGFDEGSSANRENVSPLARSRRWIHARARARARARGRGRGRGLGSRSLLPTWYPRTPLRDITHVVRAIQRRRERLERGESQETEIPTPDIHGDDSFATPSVARVNKHTTGTVMSPVTESRQCPPSMLKVQKLLQHVTEKKDGDPESLTPQKKLLNCIETVQKVVSEELSKMKRTPDARRAEREKKVQTLMSMR